jgi:hypothetical protein
MIRVSLTADGVLTIQADTDIEAFALKEWERRKNLGKTRLVIDATVKDVDSERTASPPPTKEALIEALREPKTIGEAAKLAGIAVSTAYQYMSAMRTDGLIKRVSGDKWVVA